MLGNEQELDGVLFNGLNSFPGKNICNLCRPARSYDPFIVL